jgi:hypothetical protein
MQRYEPSTTAHVIRKLLTAVVAFGTTIPNHPSIITLLGHFRCLDFQIKDLLLYLDQFLLSDLDSLSFMSYFASLILFQTASITICWHFQIRNVELS